MKLWTYKIKEWKIIPYLSRENYIAYKILLPSTTIMEETISAPWDG